MVYRPQSQTVPNVPTLGCSTVAGKRVGRAARPGCRQCQTADVWTSVVTDTLPGPWPMPEREA